MSQARGAGVNLLPLPIRRQRETRRAQFQALMAVAAAFAVLVVGFGWAVIGRAVAQSDLASAQARLGMIEAEKHKYDDVPGVYNAITSAKAEISTAMAQEVLFSTIMGNLSRTVPADTTIDSLTLTLAAGSDPKQQKQAAGDVIGTMQVTGQSPSMTAVASLLDAITAMPEYKGVKLDSAEASGKEKGGRVTYAISAQFSEAALSRRFQEGQASASPSASPGARAASP